MGAVIPRHLGKGDHVIPRSFADTNRFAVGLRPKKDFASLFGNSWFKELSCPLKTRPDLGELTFRCIRTKMT